VVRQRYPVVNRTLGWLSRYTEARMTGTGACIFGRFDNQPDAQNILALFNEKGPGGSAFVAKGLNRSPLLKFCRDFS
jgi:4-diphosphocytidyl-2-C-methyl-D-erythritol kinase